MFELLNKVRVVWNLYQAGDYREAARLAAELVAELLKPAVVQAATPGAELSEADAAELDQLCEDLGNPPKAAGAAPAGIDPATLLAIITAAVELIKWFRNRR